MALIQKYNFSMTDSVRATFHNSRYRKAVHIHQLAELVYVLEGEIRVVTNGKRIIATAGDLIIVPPYQPHSFYTEDGKTVNIWMLLFSGNLISDISMSEYMYNEYESSVFRPSDALSVFIKSRFFDTEEKLCELDQAGIRRIKGLLYPVFEEYISKISTVKAHTDKNSQIVASVMKYLAKNFYKNESISVVASAIGYSESYISHNLKKNINSTLCELHSGLTMRKIYLQTEK